MVVCRHWCHRRGSSGVPLGAAVLSQPRGPGRVILRIVDLIQTTPALALLGIIMITPLGAGKPTVIVGLALYSLLPIVRNTCLGLDQVPPYLIEAGEGMGMTRVYRLVHVELPLAAPIIFTGIRIAAVNAIGTAVFRPIFWWASGGTGLLMAMALILDLIMALAEHYLNERTQPLVPPPAQPPASAAVSAVLWLLSCAYTRFSHREAAALSSTRGSFLKFSLSTV